MSENLRLLAENKLIILYLVDKMSIGISNSEICQFMLEQNYTNYFKIQQYIEELVESGFLDKAKEGNILRYTCTPDGVQTLGFFIKHIPVSAKNAVVEYIKENGTRIRAEYEVTANYFMELNGECSVKCGVYDGDGTNLMEISITVPSREQARTICSNWKKQVNTLYGSIFKAMLYGEAVKPQEILSAKTSSDPDIDI